MFLRFLWLTLLLFASVALAADDEFACPPQIQVVATVKSVPSGWQVLKKDPEKGSRHVLEYATFTDGHPKELGYLRPIDEDKKTSGKETVVRSLFDVEGVSPEGPFLVCGYARTAETLLKPIGKGYTRCEVLTSEESKTVKSIKCR